MGLFTVHTKKGFQQIEKLVNLHDASRTHEGAWATYIPAHRPQLFGSADHKTYAFTLYKNLAGEKLTLPESTVGLISIGLTGLVRSSLPEIVAYYPLRSNAQITSELDAENFVLQTFCLPDEYSHLGEEPYARAAVAIGAKLVADGAQLTLSR